MTAFEIFVREAESCGFNDEKAIELYEALKIEIDPSCRAFKQQKEVKLTTEEAIRANYLLTKFGACLDWNYGISVYEENHKYNVKLLNKIK